jgi:hypothetical protein
VKVRGKHGIPEAERAPKFIGPRLRRVNPHADILRTVASALVQFDCGLSRLKPLIDPKRRAALAIVSLNLRGLSGLALSRPKSFVEFSARGLCEQAFTPAFPPHTLITGNGASRTKL